MWQFNNLKVSIKKIKLLNTFTPNKILKVPRINYFYFILILQIKM